MTFSLFTIFANDCACLFSSIVLCVCVSNARTRRAADARTGCARYILRSGVRLISLQLDDKAERDDRKKKNALSLTHSSTLAPTQHNTIHTIQRARIVVCS
jgi:hypothetical protein